MRIIGGHDYYDGVVPFDTDRTRVFLRDGHQIERPVSRSNFRVGAWPKGWTRELYSLEVIFCGKRYRGMELALSRSLPAKLITETQRHFVWTLERYQELSKATGFEFERLVKGKRGWDESAIYEDDLAAFFKPSDVKDLKWFIDQQILVAVAPSKRVGAELNDPKWTMNGDNLKDVHFASAVEPWRAYQELDMFLGTILVGDEDKMVRVSDDTKRDKYGFDQWSFKNQKHPSKPRHP